jgi:hypothetical protein
MKELIVYRWKNKDHFLCNIQSVIHKEELCRDFDLLIFTDKEIDIQRQGEVLDFNYVEYTFNFLVEPLKDLETLNLRKAYIENIVHNLDGQFTKVYTCLSEDHQSFQHFLSHALMQRFHQKVVLLTDKGEFIAENRETEVKVFSQNLYEHLHELVTSGNFSAAKKMITFHQIQDKRIIHLLDLGDYFKNLHIPNHNGSMYLQLLKDVLLSINEENSPEELDYIERMEGLWKNDQRAFILYLHNYAEFLYKENDLIDFIVLYYRLAEEALLYSIGWDINWYTRDERKQFFVRKDAVYSLRIPRTEKLSKHFHRYMKVLNQEIRTIEERQQVKIRRDKCVGLDRLSDRDRYFADLYQFFNHKKFEEFLDLRHEGVSGHGFADFTKEDFERILGGSPLEKFNQILTILELNPEFSVFQLVQKAILALIASYEVEQSGLAKNEEEAINY